ncbi:hypothetical protein BHE74_00035397 [Ensete ventricosum]|nr:hypothetical protein BHE74_00035397 [Ensete ventricosum]
METTISSLVPFLRMGLDAMRGRQESLPPYLEENLGSRGPRLELSLASSFDFVTSFYTSSSRLFTCRSYARSESVESDDNSCLGSRWRDCDLRDGHDSRSRWVWLFDYPVGEETGKTILRHDPPSSAKCWGLTYLTRHQPPAIKGVAGWSTLRIRSAMSPAARYQGHCRLVGPSCPLCHVASRSLSKAR